MNATLKVKSATVLVGRGTDKINLRLDAPTPFPAMNYECFCTIEAQKDQGSRWVMENLGICPNIIETNT